MKPVQLSLALGALTMFSGIAVAGSGSLSPFVPKVLPVLVQVDSHGKVTSASPATELPPKLNRLLRANLDEMIKAPAIDKNGRRMSSQFVINLAVQSSPRANGDYEVNFTYVSTSPVPAGSWYWVHTDGRQLALASQGARDRREPRPYRYDQPDYQRNYERSAMPNINDANVPVPANTFVPVSAPAPGRGNRNEQ